MATVYKRNDCSGINSWRVMIRRKGCKTKCLSFDTEEDARDWVKKNEPTFLEKSVENLNETSNESLRNNRIREAKRIRNDHKAEKRT